MSAVTAALAAPSTSHGPGVAHSPLALPHGPAVPSRPACRAERTTARRAPKEIGLP